MEPEDGETELPEVEHSDPTHEFTLSGTILVNTLFIPDMKTRFEFNLYDAYSIYKTPEAKIHANILMGTKVFDSYHYSIPMSNYDPQNHTENSTYEDFTTSSKRPMVLQS